jgi:glycosyltransferase involved in cell wall biosynthesis
MIKFSFIITAYQRYNNIQCLIHSLLLQTYDNFEVIIIHDGYDQKHEEVIKPYLNDIRFKYIYTDHRYNDWGMTLRNKGLEMVDGDWIINTNDDNYYVPVYLEELVKVIENKNECNFVYYDCVLSHNNIINHNKKDYGLLIPEIRHSYIDMGQFAVKKEVISKYKFHLTAPADGILIEEMKHELKPEYIDKILFVHN